MFGGLESERLKVAALNLFHLTASPPLLAIMTQSLEGEGRVGVKID